MLELNYKLPQGLQDETFGSYKLKDNMINSVKSIFKSYGYREVSTPTFEYYDVFSNIEGTVGREEMFKLIDESGEILVLRPDVTTPIARMVANNYRDMDDFLKLSYVSNIFRIKGKDKDSQREFTQAGIEYFGNGTAEADGEVIALAIKVLMEHFSIFQLEIGQSDYCKGLFEEGKIDKETQKLLRKYIEDKNVPEIQKILDKMNIDKKVGDVILEIPKLYGDYPYIIKKAKEISLNDKMKKAIENLEEICNIISDYGLNRYISLDLGLITDLDYYTGAIFKGYVANHGSIVLSGGRYDRLMEQFGHSMVATGFGINMDEVIKAKRKTQSIDIEDYTDYMILYSVDDRKNTFVLAEKLRNRGYIVETKYCSNERTYIENAMYRKIYNILILHDNKYKIINTKKNVTNNVDKDTFLKSIDRRKEIRSLASIH